MGIFSRLKALEARSKQITQALIDTGLAKKQSSTAAAAGADYLTSVAGGNPTYGKTYSARVDQVDDVYKSGRVKVVCNAVMGEESFDCKMATSFGGAGYGFFNVPGIGAMVLITEVEGEGWVWFACLANLELEPGGENTVTQPKGSDDEAKKVESPVPLAKYGQQDGDPKMMTHGAPEGFVVYKDNHQPEQYIWRTPKGHKIVMSEKHTEETEEKHITIKSAMGKMILLDDGDPRTDIGTEPTVPAGATGDRIIIADGEDFDVDGGPNRIWIQTSAGDDGVEDSIQVYAKNALFLETREGNINLSILDQEAEDAHILITNLAKGNLEIDIEEGDIAAVAKYRICLNAWNEDESVDPETGIPKILGSVGVRSKGAFTVRNGMGSVNQNLQMSHKKGWVTLNSGKQGLALFGQPGGVVTGAVKRAHLMGTEVYITARDHIHLEATKITMNGRTISMSENVSMQDREFDAEYNNPVPDSLSPCREIEVDTGFAAQTGGGGGGGGGGGEGGGGEGGGGDGETNPWEPPLPPPPDDDDDDLGSYNDGGNSAGRPHPGDACGSSGETGGGVINNPQGPGDTTFQGQPQGGDVTNIRQPEEYGVTAWEWSDWEGPQTLINADPMTPCGVPTGRDPYAPSTPGAGWTDRDLLINADPMTPIGPAPGRGRPAFENLPAPNPSMTSEELQQAIVDYALENDIPATHVSFNDGITPGGPGAGAGGGGGGGDIDDDLSLSDRVYGGGPPGGGGGGGGGEGGGGLTYTVDAVESTTTFANPDRHNLQREGGGDFNAQVGWFQTTSRTFDDGDNNRAAMASKTNKGLESQSVASITPAPNTPQALPGGGADTSPGGSNTSTGARGPTQSSTQYYLPPGGGEAGDAGGVP